MENNKVINQVPPVEETTEEQPEETAEENTEPEETVLDAKVLTEDITQLKSDIKTVMNSMNYLIDLARDNKKTSQRLVIKNTPPKEKTNKDYLFELFPAIQEYKN